MAGVGYDASVDRTTRAEFAAAYGDGLVSTTTSLRPDPDAARARACVAASPLVALVTVACLAACGPTTGVVDERVRGGATVVDDAIGPDGGGDDEGGAPGEDGGGDSGGDGGAGGEDTGGDGAGGDGAGGDGAGGDDTPVVPPVPTSCGDGSCTDDESCTSCVDDCGACTASCGDGACNPAAGELCTTCDADCVTGDTICGDGRCDDDEDAAACGHDCGPSPWPSDWSDEEDAALAAMNAMRAEGRDCPGGSYAPTTALVMDDGLQRLARLHAWDQSHAGYFDHTSCDGRSPWDRAAQAGVSASSENIAWGYQSGDSAVAGWMSSTAGHCDAIMSPSHDAVGIGFAADGDVITTAVFR